MGTDMLDAATGHRDVSVPIAADLSSQVVEQHRRLRPGTAFRTDPGEVIASDDVDAIYIATPPVFHAELAVAALRRGLGVFCEKPLSVSPDDSLAMIAAAEAAGVACAVNFALSDRHAVLEIERALTAGEAGEVVGVDVQLRFPRWPREFQAGAAWLDSREQGGFVREVFSHFAYLSDRLLGPLRPVHLSLDYAPGGAETTALGLLRAGDVPVHVSAFSEFAGEETYDWMLWGTRRSYLLRDWDQLYTSDGGGWERVALTGERGDDATRLSLFARAVRGESVDDLAGFDAAYRVQQVVEAFHEQGRLPA